MVSTTMTDFLQPHH